nr:uncharacterized protein LOC117279265 [Nicotiana tomentosiformis]
MPSSFSVSSKEREAKGLRAELEAAQKEQADLAEQVKRIFEVNETDSGVVASSSVPHVQRKLDVNRQLREEVDAVKAEAEVWKKNMDHLALVKEATRAQLASAETQLRSLKEKDLVQAKKIEEFSLGWVQQLPIERGWSQNLQRPNRRSKRPRLMLMQWWPSTGLTLKLLRFEQRRLPKLLRLKRTGLPSMPNTSLEGRLSRRSMLVASILQPRSRMLRSLKLKPECWPFLMMMILRV